MSITDAERQALAAFPTAHNGDPDDVVAVLLDHLRNRGIEATARVMDGTLYAVLPSGARVRPFAKDAPQQGTPPVHCWAPTWLGDDETGGSASCMELEGHEGPHGYVLDSEIRVRLSLRSREAD